MAYIGAMATLTIRNLPEATRARLRVKAAAHGHSMEEEVRRILAGEDRRAAPPVATPPAPVTPSAGPLAPAKATLTGATLLLIIAGGIAAYKSLDLIRRLRERGATVRAVMTKAAGEFITPLSVGALTGGKVFSELFDREDEHDIGHIRLARECDLVVIAPATADLLARMAAGRADDLAAAILLAIEPPDPRRAGDESGHVGQPGNPPKCCTTRRRRRPFRRPERRGDGGKRGSRRRPHGRAAGNRRSDRNAAGGTRRRCRSPAAMSS